MGKRELEQLDNKCIRGARWKDLIQVVIQIDPGEEENRIFDGH